VGFEVCLVWVLGAIQVTGVNPDKRAILLVLYILVQKRLPLEEWATESNDELGEDGVDLSVGIWVD
jgi:hypothetical protein